MFCIFERLLTPNPTNQDSQFFGLFKTICKTVRKSKNMGLQRIISALKRFQNLLQSKLQKMAEKTKFMVFRVVFEVNIQQR